VEGKPDGGLGGGALEGGELDNGEPDDAEPDVYVSESDTEGLDDDEPSGRSEDDEPEDAEVEGRSAEDESEDGWLDSGGLGGIAELVGRSELEGESEADEAGAPESSSPGVGPVPWGFWGFWGSIMAYSCICLRPRAQAGPGLSTD